ncbi:urokinase plasminogen activator surface receptor-like [Carettochelys insculpta]|uniref:urokinase plasminogen activator surface receptor-like n=1 Tax=Carettochelys insculpta TaxID=44489 RepID=UPI003EC11C10
MAGGLTLIALLALLAPASGLRCKSCRGQFGCSEVTCGDGETSCWTAVRSANVSFLRFQSVSKGCARGSRPDQELVLSSHLLALSYRARHCEGDGCNAASLEPEPDAPNQLSCRACTSHGSWCPQSARTELTCTGTQDQCLDLDIRGNMGKFANMKLKGCSSLPHCRDGLSFHTGSGAIHAHCCNTPLCNHFDPVFQARLHNGLQCYSCVGEDGVGCNSNWTSTVSCVGEHNMCLEGIGRSHRGGGDPVLVTFKGCATPAMCQSSLLALVQELDEVEVYCCTGSLCNTRIVGGQLPKGEAQGPSRPTPPPTSSAQPPSLPGQYERQRSEATRGHRPMAAGSLAGNNGSEPRPALEAEIHGVFTDGGLRSHQGENKTQGPRPAGPVLRGQGLSSNDTPAWGGEAASPSSPQTVAKPSEGGQARPIVSFPISVETEDPHGNASAPRLDQKDGQAMNTSRTPHPSGAFGLCCNLGLVSLTLLLAALLH